MVAVHESRRAEELALLGRRAQRLQERLARVELRRQWLQSRGGSGPEPENVEVTDSEDDLVVLGVTDVKVQATAPKPSAGGEAPAVSAAAAAAAVGLRAHPSRRVQVAAPKLRYATAGGATPCTGSAGADSTHNSVSDIEGASSGVPGTGLSFCVGEELRLEPCVLAAATSLAGGASTGAQSGGEGVYFSVHPPLPEGLVLDPKTGVISGAAEVTCDLRSYSITMRLESTTEVELEFGVEASMAIDADFASRIDLVQNVADLVPEPSRYMAFGDWMIWMVHRAWLNDPSLVEFDFSGANMPPPHIEPRIAPKLMAAMSWNTHIEVLNLNSANLQRSQGFELADALARNKTVRYVNIDSNCLDSSAVKQIAVAIGENAETRIEHLSVAHQKQVGKFFGRPTEEEMGKMMMRNETIVKLGVECADAHWRNIIDRALLRNQDIRRRFLQQQSAADTDGTLNMSDDFNGCPPSTPSEARPLRLLQLTGAAPGCCEEGPGSASTSAGVSDAGSGDEAPAILGSGESSDALVDYILRNHRVPTTVHLQEYAKKAGYKSVPYSAAAPMLRGCCARLLDGAVGMQVEAVDGFGTSTSGVLMRWDECGGVWALDVRALDGRRCIFRTQVGKEPTMEVSSGWAHWLRRNF
eukprot:TRINITY_DN17207_c0_g2_i1.p1 TRINITY_DN17207_c0_g2~~TRINITY_DN17207_c0_g2_i1.p1  ORF type:complete len:665 (+),score=152.73 TRINITY_DN17207_c0_g2_i1:76-1995(+)